MGFREMLAVILFAAGFALSNTSKASAGDFTWTHGWGSSGLYSYYDSDAFVSVIGIISDIDYAYDYHYFGQQDPLPTSGTGIASAGVSGASATMASAFHATAISFNSGSDTIQASVLSTNYASLDAVDDFSQAASEIGCQQIATIAPDFEVGDGYTLLGKLTVKTITTSQAGTQEENCVLDAKIAASYLRARYRESDNKWEVSWALVTASGFVTGSWEIGAETGFDLTANTEQFRSNEATLYVRTLASSSHDHQLTGPTGGDQSEYSSIGGTTKVQVLRAQ